MLERIKDPFYATCGEVPSYFFDRIKDLKYPSIKKICYLIIKESEYHKNFVVPGEFLDEKTPEELDEMVKLLDGIGIQNVAITFSDKAKMSAFCKPWVRSIKVEEALAK